MQKPILFAIDLESTLVPEVWITVAEKTGIDGLKLTTRDIADYNELMRGRIHILRENGITFPDIMRTIETIEPLSGAVSFLDRLRETQQVILISDTFYEFARPILQKLNWPTIFCHSLIVDKNGYIAGYTLRESGEKAKAVKGLQDIGFRVVAIGDSYNDTGMLGSADESILCNASLAIEKEHPEFPSFQNYQLLEKYITETF